MSLPTPPRYVVIPQERIDQAFAPDKPRRALLATFIRILSLAWEKKYQQTPPLHEIELIDFLKLSRRQYFEQKAELELLGWLRSSHPFPGYVQFDFSHRAVELMEPVSETSAESRTASAESRTLLKRIEEEESLKLNSLNPPPPSSEETVRKTALREIALVEGPRKTVVADDAHRDELRILVENLPLLFEPEEHGLLDLRPEFLVGIPERMLGWIAKAYQDRRGLQSPLGFIVTHILNQDAPHRYFLDHFQDILPEGYLEAIGRFQIECRWCSESFSTRAAEEAHCRTTHSHHCDDCGKDFEDAEQLKTHWNATHDPYRVHQPGLPEEIVVQTGDPQMDQVWQSVLGSLQLEMARASFDTWVRDTTPVRYDGNVLFIGARNAYARDWLENRLTDTVNRMLSNVAQAGMLPNALQVRFVVLEGARA